MKIIFMGTPKFSVPILEALNEKYDVCLVVSQPNQIGKKGKIIYTPVAAKAQELGLTLAQPEKIKEIENQFIDLNADILITAAYGQFVPSRMLKLFKKCINVHGSLLPKRRGGAPIQRSIIEGDTETGITIMEMVKQMDAGDIFASRSTPILDTDNNESLFDRLSLIGRDLLMEVIEDIYNGKLKGIPQNEAEVTISPNISVSEEKIDFNLSARDVFNKIRGLSINPGAYTTINGFRIKVYSSKIVDTTSDAKASEIIDCKKHLIIKCSEGAIELIDIKPEGKGIMNAQSFLNGQRIFKLGDVFI